MPVSRLIPPSPPIRYLTGRLRVDDGSVAGGSIEQECALRGREIRVIHPERVARGQHTAVVDLDERHMATA